MDFFLSNKNINFKFLFILNINNITFENNEILVPIEYNKNDQENLIEKLKPFILDQRYIKYNHKSIICFENLKNISNNNINIQQLRQHANKLGIGELYIISSIVKEDISKINEFNSFDSGYESLSNYLNTNIFQVYLFFNIHILITNKLKILISVFLRNYYIFQ